MAGGNDIATIGLKVDSSGVVVATDALQEFVGAGKEAEKQTDKLGNEAKQASEQVKGLGGAANQTATATDKLSGAQGKAAQAANQHGLSVKQQAAAMRLLPAQITDIVTGLVSGQPAYLVAIQQGGQLKDSFGGIIPAARALLSVFTPMNLLLGAVAGSAAAAFLSFQKGQQESEDLVRSLILTGNAAGVTAGQLNVMAIALDGIQGTRAKAAEVLGLLASTGRVGADSLQSLAQATIAAERVLGQSAETTVKTFSELGKAPLDASVKLNETLNYLNASTIEQIANLEKAGRSTDAARVAQEAYADALKNRSGEMQENIGTLERLWNGVRDAIKEAADGALSFGRMQSAEERLSQLVARRGDRPLGDGYTLGLLDARRRDDVEEAQLRDRVAFLKAGADAQAEVARRIREGNEARQRNDKLVESTLTNQEKLNKAIEQYQRDQEAIRKGGFTADTPEQQAKVMEALRKQYADKAKRAEVTGIPDETFIANLKSDSEEIAKTFKEQADAATKVSQEIEKQAGDTDKLRGAAADYLSSLERGYKRQLDDFGKGPAARRYSAGRDQIDDRVDQQKLQLDRDLSLGRISQGMYDSELSGLQTFHDQADAQWNDYYARIEERSTDFSAGFNDAFLSYADSIKNVGATIGKNLISTYDQAIGRASDLAAANILWGEGGSEAAKALARDILTSVVSGFIQAGAQAATFYALQKAGIVATTATSVAGTTTTAAASTAASAKIAAAGAPAAAVTTLATGGANVPFAIAGIALVSAAIGALLGGAFEKGGRPPLGKVSLVGEGGPELFIPDSAGTIIPNGGWSSGTPAGSAPMTVVNNAPGVSIRRVGNVMTVDMADELVEVAVGRSQVVAARDLEFNGPLTQQRRGLEGTRQRPTRR